METMLKFRCDGCDKEFIVMDRWTRTPWPAPTVRRRSRCPSWMTKDSSANGGAWQKLRSTAT